ncbi:ribosomal protection-like ABC-F family protein [Terribacillus sp. DMT04]|uniref:ribosomal protection-like ABC-F family protein n=1 Tax=Terribacillus sp. DMT04 TaxID=2850441 RepID=UPI001C2C896B|nr:ABC-F type ribosomal protection protein [Terribacillus sp. DMT04]QXE00195.1 ABC-F type ribosomal protection protein [Terribacillus sp. DMT04]
MRELVKLQDVTYMHTETVLFEKAQATVHEGDIVGIIGRNGAGKSTLLDILAGRKQPTSGSVWRSKAAQQIKLIEQENNSFSSETSNTEEMRLRKLWKVPSVPYEAMSGGEKLKARLARGFASNADILLLDEPTNHLDEESVRVLFHEMKESTKTFLIVSHDRYLLDQAATKIWSIEQIKLYTLDGNYTDYTAFREKKKADQQHTYEKQQKRIKRVEGQMLSLQSWSAKAHAQSTKQEGAKEYYRKKAKRMDKQVKSKQKRLEKELAREKTEAVAPEQAVSFQLKHARKVGKRFLACKNVTKTYEKKALFEDVNFTVQYGEKINLLGANGSGKTTFLNMIVGKEAYKGEIWVSPPAKIGYLSQNVYDLPLDKKPSELFHKETYAERGIVRNLLIQLGFETESWELTIKDMSMGERVKLKLMQHILEEKDVLLLDEPTNHMDLPSREQLEKTLLAYQGTLIVVSHDRYFRKKVTDTQLLIAEGTIQRRLDGDKTESMSDKETMRLQLANERQEVLGKLSLLTAADTMYKELDKRFNELTKQLNDLN